MVKVVRTTIGPHLTLMIKAARVMDLQQEIEAGFRLAKPFFTPPLNNQPKKRKYTLKTPIPQPTMHKVVRVVKPSPDPPKGPSTSAPPHVSETPRSVVVETEEPWQVPHDIPNIVQQISQAHRRLENLLMTLSSKAPPTFMRKLDSQFYKIQREAWLHQDTKSTQDQPNTNETGLLGSQVTQIGRLESRLAETEELNAIYIEHTFELEEEVTRLKTEVQVLTQKNQENMAKLQSLEENHSQQSEAKDKLLATLQDQNYKLKEEAITYNNWVKESHKIRPQESDELGRLRTENEILKAAKAGRETYHNPEDDPRFGQTSKRPIDHTERQVLAEGAANQLLNDLQQELQLTKQENENLQHQLHQKLPSGQIDLPPSCMHSKEEIYHRLLENTEPLKTVMQYYKAFGAINLCTSNLPVLKRGITLNLVQFKALWEKADPRAKDTLAFMWALGVYKLPLGTIEVVTGSPPFYIKRYILRSVAWLAQHKATQVPDHNANQSLPTLHPYTHSQRIEISRLQCKHKTIFQQATDTLRREDTTICFEAVRRHQWLLEHHPSQQTNVTIPQLKEYVTQTLEEQQIPVNKGRFGVINHGTILRMRTTDQSNYRP